MWKRSTYLNWTFGHWLFGISYDCGGITTVGDTWKDVYLSTVLLKQSTAGISDITEYDLEHVQEKVWMITKIIILPFKMITVKGKVKLSTHSKCVNIMVKPVISYAKHVATAHTCGVLRRVN